MNVDFSMNNRDRKVGGYGSCVYHLIAYLLDYVYSRQGCSYNSTPKNITNLMMYNNNDTEFT